MRETLSNPKKRKEYPGGVIDTIREVHTARLSVKSKELLFKWYGAWANLPNERRKSLDSAKGAL